MIDPVHAKLELHAVTLHRDPERQYTPEEIDLSNGLLQAWHEKRDGNDLPGMKNIEAYLEQNYAAKVVDHGKISEGEHGLPARIAHLFGGLI